MEDNFLRLEKVSYNYALRDSEGKRETAVKALKDISLEIKKGEFVAILGRNASGKSTLARLISGIILPTSGDIFIDGNSIFNYTDPVKQRCRIGTVFQNPDDGFVALNVKDEIAFGPRNLNFEPERVKKNVENALKAVGMEMFADVIVENLSGGEKQRIAIASVLAMEPDCIVLDEALAMLDAKNRKEVLELLYKINKHKKITIIMITHEPYEVINADRLYVLNNGEVAAEGTFREIFSCQVEDLGLKSLLPVKMAKELNKKGIPMPINIITNDEFAKEAVKLSKTKPADL